MVALSFDGDSTSDMMQEESIGWSKTIARPSFQKRHYENHAHDYDHHHHANACGEPLQCDDIEQDDDHSTVATAASSISSGRFEPTNRTAANAAIVMSEEEFIDPSAILEARMLVKLAEQTSQEMQQVVAWWTTNNQEKDQEEALPNNILACPIDWWTTSTAASTTTTMPLAAALEAEATEAAALDFAMIVPPVAKSREEALEQSYLVDMVEERTRDMADFVDQLNGLMKHVHKSQEPNDLLFVSTTNSHVASRRRSLSIILLFISLAAVILLSNRETSQFTPNDGTTTITATAMLNSQTHQMCPAEFDNPVSFLSHDECQSLRWSQVALQDCHETC